MTKTEFVEKYAEKTGMSKKDAAAAVKKAVEALESVSGDTNFLKTLAQTTLNRVQ